MHSLYYTLIIIEIKIRRSTPIAVENNHLQFKLAEEIPYYAAYFSLGLNVKYGYLN